MYKSMLAMNECERSLERAYFCPLLYDERSMNTTAEQELCRVHQMRSRLQIFARDMPNLSLPLQSTRYTQAVGILGNGLTVMRRREYKARYVAFEI
jgi:hypothetical protein